MTIIFRNTNGPITVAKPSVLFPPTVVTINGVTTSASPYTYPFTAADVNGTTTTNGINYNVYSFCSVYSTTTYTVNYTCASPTTIYALAVGGGGGGGASSGGGGGGGGVVMMPVSLPAGINQTITVSVGAGGAGDNTITATVGSAGNTTTVTFNGAGVTPSLLTAYGGGKGGGDRGAATSGASGGGQATSQLSGVLGRVAPNNNNYNYGNYGGQNDITGYNFASGGGGGGAGTAGAPPSFGYSGYGGSGIQCFLPGISTFTPSSTPYGNYYWGGGGGGWSYYYSGGNGGIGGGGGGATSQQNSATYNNIYVGGQGGVGLNSGTSGIANMSGSNVNGGSGGANTGGGGGGGHGSSIAGSGGSGIVVIAFPAGLTSITSNSLAVLPPSLYSNLMYRNATLNTGLSASAYSSIKGAFSCKLINYNYFGPVLTLRYSTDVSGLYAQNFYADICGNLGTGYLGTGQSITNWLLSNSPSTPSYAYVMKWYNQGMDTSFNGATQYVPSSQPIYDISNGVINFSYTGGIGVSSPNTNCFLALPNSAFPYGNTSFTYSTRWYNFNGSTSSNQSFFEAGTGSGMVAMYYFNNPNYQFGVFGGISLNSTAVPYTPSSSWTITYDGTNAYSYVAGTNTFTSAMGARSQTNTNNQIGGGAQGYYGQIQMYDFYVFSTAISSADRAIVEATPSVYFPPPTFTVTITNAISNSFTATWTAVSGASTYIMFINGVYYGLVTSGQTISPSVPGSWNVNIYAYNSDNNIVATSYNNVGSLIFRVKASSTTVPTIDTTNVFNITNAGTVTAVSDPLASGRGYVLNFNGTNNLLLSNVVTTSASTRTFWVYTTTPTFGGGIILASNVYYIFFGGTSYLYVTLTAQLGTPQPYEWSYATTISTTAWTFVAVTTTGETSSLYINGTLVTVTRTDNAVTTTIVPQIYNGEKSNIGIGSSSSSNQYFKGYIDDLRQYNYVLTSTQINGVMNNTY